MNRRLFVVPGVVVLLGLALFTLAFGPPHTPSAVAAMSCFVVAGVGDVALALGLLANGVATVVRGGEELS